MKFGVGLALALATIILSACGAPKSVEGGWRKMTAAEVEAAKKAALSENDFLKAPPALSVTGDFNGDGRRDEAAFWVNAQDAALFFLSGTGAAPQRLSDPRPRGELVNASLAVLPPGVYPTACSRGMGDDSTPCRATITLSAPGIEHITWESASVVYFWNGASFDVEGLSD